MPATHRDIGGRGRAASTLVIVWSSSAPPKTTTASNPGPTRRLRQHRAPTTTVAVIATPVGLPSVVIVRMIGVSQPARCPANHVATRWSSSLGLLIDRPTSTVSAPSRTSAASRPGTSRPSTGQLVDRRSHAANWARVDAVLTARLRAPTDVLPQL
jgi:hypothetical protein